MTLCVCLRACVCVLLIHICALLCVLFVLLIADMEHDQERRLETIHCWRYKPRGASGGSQASQGSQLEAGDKAGDSSSRRRRNFGAEGDEEKEFFVSFKVPFIVFHVIFGQWLTV